MTNELLEMTILPQYQGILFFFFKWQNYNFIIAMNNFSVFMYSDFTMLFRVLVILIKIKQLMEMKSFIILFLFIHSKVQKTKKKTEREREKPISC